MRAARPGEDFGRRTPQIQETFREGPGWTTALRTTKTRIVIDSAAMQPPAKKRRLASAAVEEIKFDPAARQEYLTGFHKRKLQRAKQAHEAAEKKARLERIEERRKVRRSPPRS